MYGILISALNFFIGVVLRQAVFKTVTLFVIYFIIQAFVGVLVQYLPKVVDLSAAFSSIPSGVWWFIDLFNISVGAPLILSAYVYKFLIRRIPMIG
jgi:hypothetical protein